MFFKKKKEEEEELFKQIKEYKKTFRLSFKEKLFAESKERLNKGEVFFEDHWVSKDKISMVQKSILKRGLVVFLEIHGVFLFIVLFNLFLLKIFKIFLYPQ